MKRWMGLFLLFSLSAGLLCGCGAVSAMESPAAQPGRDWAEPDRVDDSFSADYDDDTDIEEWIRNDLLPTYVERWVEDGTILKTELKGYRGWDQSCWYGWVCFTGRPKTELGWRETEFEGLMTIQNLPSRKRLLVLTMLSRLCTWRSCLPW